MDFNIALVLHLATKGEGFLFREEEEEYLNYKN